MKKIILTIIPLAISLLCIAQSEIPFKSANTIIIKTELPNDEAYLKLGQTLVANGYSIDVNNKEFYQLKTGFKSPTDYAFSYQLTVSSIDGNLIIKPSINSGTAVLGIYDWYYLKSRSTKNAVVENEIIKHLGPLGTVIYEKR